MNLFSRLLVKRCCLWAVLFFVQPNLQAVTYPQDYGFSFCTDWLLDRGDLWHYNSLFHPLDIAATDTSIQIEKSDWVAKHWLSHFDLLRELHNPALGHLSLLAYTGVGLVHQAGQGTEFTGFAVQPYLWIQTNLRHGFYTQTYMRATNKASSLEHYSGISRPISRAGFNTAEIDQSIIGFTSEHFSADFGRSREIWGPESKESLVLSGTAPAYERLAIELRYKHFGAKWFYGFLDAVPYSKDSSLFVQRYISGRAIQYYNSKDFVIGLGEVSVLAGINRPIDWSHLNPLAFHLEVEQNGRSNNLENWENAVWFLSIDKRLGEHLRLSGSLIIDEIKLERSETKKMPDMLGWQGRIAWSDQSAIGWTTLYSSYTRVDTYTYQHTSGYANWVTRNQFLGYPLGNDIDELIIGGRFVSFSIPVALELTYEHLRQGENSLTINNRYYKSCIVQQMGHFPSGEVQWLHFITFTMHFQPNSWLKFDVIHKNTIQKSKDMERQYLWIFNARLQIPIIFTNI